MPGRRGTAARRATAPERAAIAELAARLERAAGQDDVRAFLRLDGELRQAMARAARNEIAAAAVFLASSGADMINGADLLVDGGYTVK